MKSNRGFTLLETLVAVAILAGGLLVVVISWSGNLMRIEKAQINAVTANLLQMKMTEMELRYTGKPLAEVKETDAGNFGAKYPQYSWTMMSRDFQMPDISAGFTAREGGADQLLLTIIKTFTEAINKSIKELSVTVMYKNRAGRELKNTATTYIIDYAQDLALGGGQPGAPNQPAPTPKR